MQVFDLTQLRTLPRISVFSSNFSRAAVPSFEESAHYDQFGSCHNIAINEESGYAYGVGSRTCSGGLHIVDINDPKNPTYVACFGGDGYVHDTQCVNYNGPDPNYANKEICFCFNEDTLTIVDVSAKQQNSFTIISRTAYPDNQYTHQGWLSEDRNYIFLDDELDELNTIIKNTRTRVFQVTNLRAPRLASVFTSTERSIDHNLYTLGDRVYLSNYCAGLRVYDVSNPTSLSELAYFDVSPTCSTIDFLGTWSNYPYFPSGNIVVSSIERGLFVLRMTVDDE